MKAFIIEAELSDFIQLKKLCRLEQFLTPGKKFSICSSFFLCFNPHVLVNGCYFLQICRLCFECSYYIYFLEFYENFIKEFELKIIDFNLLAFGNTMGVLSLT